VAAFDAGAVESRLTVDTSQFDHDLAAAEARVKRFEDSGHKVKISAEFDSSSVTKARQQFAQLDQQISKDAMNRLRSSPQGSVLGALNALFSPHPVTGAPTPQQAAQQGLLGKILTQPGGGGQAGPSGSSSGSGTQGNVVQQVLGDSAGTTSQGNANQRVSTVGLPNTTTTDNVNVVGAPTDNSIKTTDTVNTVGLPTDNTIATTDRVSTVGLPTDNDITTQDRVNVTGLPTSGGAVTTQDRVNVTGLPTSGGKIMTDDKVEPELDEASLNAQADKAGKDAADTTNDSMTKETNRKGSGWFSGFLSGIPGMIAGLFNGNGAPGTSAGSGGGGNAKGTSLLSLFGGGGGGESSSGDESVLDKGLIGAIGPGILGTSFKASSIAGLLGAGVGALPALAGGLAPLGIAGAGAGILTAGASQLIGTANQSGKAATQGPLFAQAQAAGQALQAMVQTAAAGLTTPLKNLFAQVPALAKQITPALSQIFSSTAGLIQPVVTGLVGALKQIAPGLSAAFKATGPLLQPLIAGIGSLVSGLLPGLVSLLKAAAPAVSVVAGFFGSLGANLGAMFRQFSTVIGPSSTILKALLDVVTGLLPVIGGLAQVMAGVLGPAFTAFAGTIQALEPFLVGIGKIFAQFAGAVLTDLSGGLQLVASVLKAVAPAFNVLATSLGSVFTTLESKGGFAQLGNVLEGIAAPLGNLITALVRGLAPAIPPILTLFSDLVNVVSTVGVKVLTALIPPITNLATIALGALMRVLPVVLPVVTQFINVFTADAGTVIAQVGAAVLNLATVALLKLLQAAQPLIPVTLSLLNAFTPLLNILTPVVADTITAIADALAAVVNAIPAPVVTAVAVAIGAVIGALKLWGLATAGVAAASAGLETVMGTSFATAIAGAVTNVAAFAVAAEGASAAETAMVGASLALEAVNPLVWVGVALAPLALLTAALITTSAQSATIAGEFAQQNQQIGYNIDGYTKLAATIDTASQGYAKFAASSGDAVRGGAAGAQQLSAQLSQQALAVALEAGTLQTRLTSLSSGLGVSQKTIEQWASAAGISASKFAGAGENVGLLTTQVVAFVNKNAEAVTATSSLGTNIAIFGDDAFSATTQLDAFNAIFQTLVGNLLTKQQAITQGQQAFDNLKQSIAQNGAAATTTQQSFEAYIGQIQSSADALEKSGASVNTINGYLQTQIGHLESLGPLNKDQQADLTALKAAQDAYANSTNGLNSAQLTLIGQFESHLIPDLQKLHADTPLVNADISNLTNSIIQTGAKSASTAADRAALIKDLENAGVSAQTATGFVNGLQGSIKTLAGKVVTVGVIGSGSGTITFAEQNIKNAATGLLEFHAAGGPIGGHGGPTQDNIPVWASTGEFMMQAAAVSKYGLPFMEAVNAQKLAAGGPIDISSILAAPDWMASTMASAAKSAEGTDAALMIADMKAKVAAAAAAAAAAAKLAAGTFISSGGAAGGIIQAMFASMAAAKGWTGAELTALLEVESREAGFNMTAQNPSSGAYGLAQFINGASEYAQYGGNSTTASGQITGMLNYISQRYGDPIAAWQHELDFGWYANGGMITEPVIGRGLNSGRGYMLGERGSEMVTPVGGGQGKSMDDLAARLDQLHADMREMVSATRAVPAGVGQHVGGAINGASHDASFRSRYPR
jgi:phage-related protein